VSVLSAVADEELPWGTETPTQTLGFGAVVVFASTWPWLSSLWSASQLRHRQSDHLEMGENP